MNDKAAIKDLEKMIVQLEAKGAPQGDLVTAIGEALGSLFRASGDEVALFGFTPDRMALRFILPAKLRSAGLIPVVSKVALVARTARERHAEIVNDFVSRSHARVFEGIRPGEGAVLPIQKIMSAPVVYGDHVVGVVQISRKGKTAISAGPDFTYRDLGLLLEINALTARLIISSKLEHAGFASGTSTVAGRPMGARVRRSARVCITIPISVVYKGPGDLITSEDSQTTIVSPCGAALVLKRAIEAEQVVVLTDRRTGEEAFCRVAAVRPSKSGNYEVGVDFTEPRPYFWRIAFPPENQDPSERKRFSGSREKQLAPRSE